MEGIKGSPSRDLFKQLHRDHEETERWFYGSDVDFCFVTKRPEPDIVAVLDYKQPADSVSFAEVIVYNSLLDAGFSVYIIEGRSSITATEKEDHTFDIYQYERSPDNPVPSPPEINKTVVVEGVGWTGFFDWEQSLREQHRQGGGND